MEDLHIPPSAMQTGSGTGITTGATHMLPAHSSEPQQSSVFSQEPKRGEQVGGGGAWQIAPLQVKSTLQQGRAPTTHRAVNDAASAYVLM